MNSEIEVKVPTPTWIRIFFFKCNSFNVLDSTVYKITEANQKTGEIIQTFY